MSGDIPVTTKKFERWFSAHRGEWPIALRGAGQLALLTHHSLDQSQVWKSRSFISDSIKYLVAFEEAYKAWRKC